MKQIALSKNGKNKGKYFTLVDDKDYKWLNGFNWQYGSDGYVSRYYKFKIKSMHRLIMGNPQSLIDHKDCNPLNNQRSNLRLCNLNENARNVKKAPNCSSIYKGVCWDKETKDWQVHIRFNKKLQRIGRFKSELHAAMAYDIWAKENFGEFARLNFAPL